MNRIRSLRDADWADFTAMATQHPTQPQVAADLFEKARNHERDRAAEGCA